MRAPKPGAPAPTGRPSVTPPADAAAGAAPASEAQRCLDGLGRELTCPVCLCIFSAPVVRLPCCHYFCEGCIRPSLAASGSCPMCKAPCGRRDVAACDALGRIVGHYSALAAQLTSAPPPSAPPRAASPPVAAAPPGARGALRFMPGVDDAEFRSPTHSPSASEIAAARRRPTAAAAAAAAAGVGASPSAGAKRRRLSRARSESPLLGDEAGARAALGAILAGLGPASDDPPADAAAPAPAPARRRSSGAERRRRGSGDGGAPEGEAARRIPARLQPWVCGACTLENRGDRTACEVCATARGAAAPAAQALAAAAAAEAAAEPAAAASQLASELMDGGGDDDDAAGPPAAAARQGSKGQRKLSSGRRPAGSAGKSKRAKSAAALPAVCGRAGKPRVGGALAALLAEQQQH